MIVYKLLLDRAVKSFTMGIHFRRFGIGVPMGLMEHSNLSVKVLHKLAAIIR